ncbi:MAG: hypothetical protein LBK99_00925, partial [Opitutaceae bacterium]|nr:hypothetical protein [Opitutaceae bacterium]
LPPLSDLLSNVGDGKDKVSKQSVLTKQLRDISLKFQTDTHQSFYSMREVVEHFDLPLHSVSLVYGTLEREGLLNRCRGSRTLLVGKEISPRKQVRAIVGLPVWQRTLAVSAHSRSFHAELENRLRQQGFVASLVFFEREEVASPDFTRRLLDHDFDYVFWHTPPPKALNTLYSLKDRGIRQITVQSDDNRLNIPLPGYLQNWQTAYLKMAETWRQDGITRVLAPGLAPSSKNAGHSFVRAMEICGIEVYFFSENGRALRDAVATAVRGDAPPPAVAFLDQEGADSFCNENPSALEEIIHMTRVAFCRGLIRVPWFAHRDARVDVVHFSAVEMASQIARDLRETLGPAPQLLHTFLATWHPSIPLRIDNKAGYG